MTKKYKGLSVRSDGVYVLSKTIDGTRRRFLSKDPAECYRKYNAFIEGKTKGPIFREAAEQYERTHFDDVRPGTLRSYTAALASAVERFGNLRVSQITPADIKQYLNGLGKRFAYKTVRNYKGQLSAVFKYAITDMGANITNPCDNVTIAKGLPRRTRSDITDEQKRIITDYQPGTFILPLLILYTGCRCGEACALTWSDIDFDNKVITIDKQITWTGNQPQIAPQKTAQSKRVVPLLTPLENALNTLPTRQTCYQRVKHTTNALNTLPHNGYIVGGMLTRTQLENRWRAYCKTYGLLTDDGKPAIDRHQLRHAYAGILYQNNIDAFAAMHLMGHSDIKTTLNIYTHWRQKDVDKVGAQLNAALRAQNVPK